MFVEQRRNTDKWKLSILSSTKMTSPYECEMQNVQGASILNDVIHLCVWAYASVNNGWTHTISVTKFLYIRCLCRLTYSNSIGMKALLLVHWMAVAEFLIEWKWMRIIWPSKWYTSFLTDLYDLQKTFTIWIEIDMSKFGQVFGQGFSIYWMLDSGIASCAKRIFKSIFIKRNLN